MRLLVALILGLVTAGPPATAAQPHGVMPRGDAFDQLSSSFVIRDWISFARDEHDRLEGVQSRIHPRFFPVTFNTGTTPPPKVTYDPIPLWDMVASLVKADSMQFVPDPILACVSEGLMMPELHGILEFEHTIKIIRGREYIADRVE